MPQSLCPICQAPIGDDEEACGRCGYNLRGTTRGFTPTPLDAEGVGAVPTPDHGATLQVVRGPAAGVVYHLAGDDLTIGRTPQCSVFLNDMTVSRLHARLHREGGAYVLTDENSFNGVRVNNSSIESKALRSGDFIQIGTFSLLFEED